MLLVEKLAINMLIPAIAIPAAATCG